VYLVTIGEFEVTKKIKMDTNTNTGFDMMEFLPQKKNKIYKYNVKNGRFINVINTFKTKN
jgi:hypothetical protein